MAAIKIKPMVFFTLTKGLCIVSVSQTVRLFNSHCYAQSHIAMCGEDFIFCGVKVIYREFSFGVVKLRSGGITAAASRIS